jgi:hypothetical protein
MPLYDVTCVNNHPRTVYYARAQDKRCRTHVCPQCGHTQGFVLSFGQGLTYMSEQHPVTFENMGHAPVTITSPKQHADEMRKRGIAWMPQRRGMPGAWT